MSIAKTIIIVSLLLSFTSCVIADNYFSHTLKRTCIENHGTWTANTCRFD